MARRISCLCAMGLALFLGSLMISGTAKAESTKMFKLTIMYPKTAEGTFDMDYYLNKHMPLSLERQGEAVKSLVIEKGYDPEIEGISLAYVVICHFTYETQQAFEDAFFPHMEELQGDIANYTDIQPIIQFSTIEMER